MPFADPAMHEKRASPVAELAMMNMAEGLELLASGGRSPPPRTANTNPLTIDAPTMARINAALERVAEDKYHTTFDKCNPEQKANVLLLTLQTQGELGLRYDRRMDQKPQTVTEFLASGSGNCADFSRLFVAVAKEKGLPVQMVSVTFQTMDGSWEEEQHLAVFNTGDKMYYLDLSNQILRPYSGFATTQDLVKDPGFQQAVLQDYKSVMKDGKTYRIAEMPLVISGENTYEATYWADVGHYRVGKGDWKTANADYEKARALGFETYWTLAEQGYAAYQAGNYPQAISFYEKALSLRETPTAYLGLGLSYAKDPKHRDYEKAITALKKSLTIDDNYLAGQVNLAAISLNYGVKLMNSGNYDKAISAFDDALHYYKAALGQIIDPKAADVIERDIVKAYLDKAKVYANQGQDDKAIEVLREAIDYSKKRGMPTTEMDTLLKSLTSGNP